MRNRKVLAVSILASVVAVILPLAGSIFWAWRSAEQEQRERLEHLARETVTRGEKVIADSAVALKELATLPAGDCSDRHLTGLWAAILGSRYVRIAGRIEGDVVTCATLATLPVPTRLPDPDLVTGDGTRVWFWNPPWAGERLIVAAQGNHVIAINGDELVDVVTGAPDRTLALFELPERVLLASLNDPPVDEMAAFLKGGAAAVSNTRSYAAAFSDRYPIAAVTSESTSSLDASRRNHALVMLPLGVLLAGGLAAGVGRFMDRQLSLHAQIAAGLENGDIYAEYQPIVELDSGRCVGAEALARWRRADGEQVRPDIFVPVAEEAGLMERLADRMVICVVNDLHDLLAARKELHIAINLSASDLMQERVGPMIERAIGDRNIGRDQIWLEATERGFMRADEARVVIGDLRAQGHFVSIDDFGTGYSSLSYLQTFQVDALKIDKSFVDAIATGAVTSGVIDHIIGMARSLGLQMVAEGVETLEQAEYLRVRGVEYGQGWYFSKSLGPREFARFVEERNGGAAGPGTAGGRPGGGGMPAGRGGAKEVQK